MKSQRIPEHVWEEIENEFYKQIGFAILDFQTFRGTISERDISRIIPKVILSIAWTDSNHKTEKVFEHLPDKLKNEIKNNLTWAILEGYLIASGINSGFRLQEMEANCKQFESWMRSESKLEEQDNEWEIYQFAMEEGLKLLYSKRPVVITMIHELLEDTTLIDFPPKYKNSNEGKELLSKGMVLNALIGASLWEFDKDVHGTNKELPNWLSRANRVFELKPNIAGVGININELIGNFKR